MTSSSMGFSLGFFVREACIFVGLYCYYSWKATWPMVLLKFLAVADYSYSFLESPYIYSYYNLCRVLSGAIFF